MVSDCRPLFSKEDASTLHLAHDPFRKPGSGAPATAFDLKRYIRPDGNMVTELSYPNKPGVTMARVFVKQ